MATAVFSPEQIAALSAPLDRAKVQTRSQAGRSLAYLEGWQAIAEANRIFGFDGWQRETIAVQCVSERERTLGSGNRAGWGVTYTARVRIRVGDVIREGSGAGTVWTSTWARPTSPPSRRPKPMRCSRRPAQR